jgi:hypothetical protein
MTYFVLAGASFNCSDDVALILSALLRVFDPIVLPKGTLRARGWPY